MAEKPEVRDPKAGDYVRMTGTCLRVETVQPPAPPPETWFVFETVSASWELRLNAKTIYLGQSYNEFYGAGTAVESALAEAKKYAETNHIAGPGSLAVVVLRRVERRRGKRDDRAFYANGYAPEFPSFRDFEKVGDEEKTVVWSSAE